MRIELEKLKPNMQKNQEKVEAKQQELKDNQTKLEILVESHFERVDSNQEELKANVVKLEVQMQ